MGTRSARGCRRRTPSDVIRARAERSGGRGGVLRFMCCEGECRGKRALGLGGNGSLLLLGGEDCREERGPGASETTDRRSAPRRCQTHATRQRRTRRRRGALARFVVVARGAGGGNSPSRGVFGSAARRRRSSRAQRTIPSATTDPIREQWRATMARFRRFLSPGRRCSSDRAATQHLVVPHAQPGRRVAPRRRVPVAEERAHRRAEARRVELGGGRTDG